MSYKLVLLRHGQSAWNLENKFTGWIDVPLTEQGETEARRAGQDLARAGIKPDILHTSLQVRAIHTAELALHECGRSWIPVRRSWRLNERHYGALQGKDKAATTAEFGPDKVKVWRRSYDIPPPDLPADSPWDVHTDRRYAGIDVPRTESLKDTIARALPCYQAEVEPALRSGKRVLIAAHGNSLRGIIKYLSNIGDQEIVGLEIPTGQPIVYELGDDLTAIRRYDLS